MSMPPNTRLALFLDILSSNTAKVTELAPWTLAVASLRAFIVSKAEEKDRTKVHDWELMALVSFILFYLILYDFILLYCI
jgi:hypothetical protein